jgi:hypothetical protein
MAKKTGCRLGQHRFISQAGVGAGIRRNVCDDCGTVAIMLTDESPVTTVSSRLVTVWTGTRVTDDDQELDLLTSSAPGIAARIR